MRRTCAAVASGVGVMLLVSLAPPGAADLKVASPVFARGVVFKDNGNVRPLGQIFEHVPPGLGQMKQDTFGKKFLPTFLIMKLD